ncbi:hypothetical protein SUGI_0306330 [Cryptomeria japonica]|uniref:glycine-rich cell wall structural protein 2 n=1 Tax=Cryptomeria japonica TaxID=3369 RepID=UPI002408DBA4|nr:glycine-rich cell wall structural protein 2 [Cryptomeria japonica]GLJ17590.1 hypothetical protein SUGI_0306330 [Cryptomeria japonica]
MALRTEILISILLAIVVSCNVEAREGGFFNPPVPVKENAPYLDPKEYYPTGRENKYNSYSGEGQGNGYGNGAGEGGGYKEGVNGYGKGAEYTTQNGGGEAFGNGGGYGSGEWHGSNGGGGYREGGQYGGYNTQFGNGNRYGTGYGAGFGNGNGEYVPNNGYNQENP